ncbi:LytTR family DNA-binding domain-containing protein [Enterococcus hulanensis]|uniref:LytR/AlgR family response regulator transcription factor n=1 Tax=Enterococcus hulanensis TaxID=2559929 RepID=UPI00288CABB8|nr:LytTR family DNA-binding domain-containing protein [Enterococcus hulanensis]MDT2660507.1 LytTR family DNA-binding domain-containing protein [Enterococcus hulanensis]
MLNIVICDDDPMSVAQMESFLFEISEELDNTFNIDVYLNGQKFLNQYSQEMFIIDILFLDIEMGTCNGLDVARELRKMNSEMLIIFFSSHEKYLIELFEVTPFRFVKKPINKNEVKKVTVSAIQALNEQALSFNYSFKQKISKLYLKEIFYFESRGRKILIFGSHNTMLGSFYDRLNNVELQLKTDTFIRVHQSYLVNYHHIRTLSQKEIVLSDEVEIQISEDRSKSVRSKYIQLSKREINS